METQPDGPIQRPTTNAPGSGDWPTRAADLVDTVVALLRDKTVRPLALVARVIVFGVLVFAAALVTVVLLSIALIRLLTVYVFDGRVWAADLLVGAVFVLIGLLAWTQRTTRTPKAGAARQ
jgi:hypothetical protein